MLRRENGPAGTIEAPTFPSPPIDFSRSKVCYACELVLALLPTQPGGALSPLSTGLPRRETCSLPSRIDPHVDGRAKG